MNKKHHFTVFLPGLQGQYKVWRNSIVQKLERMDEVVSLGNVIGANDYTKATENDGPNAMMLKYFALYRQTQPNWTQIIGPNEMAALNAPEEWTNGASRSILRAWWFGENPVFRVAAVNRGRLITHGGLTYGQWLDIGSPETAEDAAAAINRMYADTIYQGPCLRLGNFPNYAANPVWADPLMEFYPSWITAPVPMPFDQIHGSGSINNDHGRHLISEPESPMSHIDDVSFRNFGSTAWIKGKSVLAVDMTLTGKMLTSIPRPQALYVEKYRITPEGGQQEAPLEADSRTS